MDGVNQKQDGPEDQPLWTIDQLAAYLQTAKSTLYNWRSDGIGPKSMKIGRGLRYRRSDVERWIDAQASHRQTESVAIAIEPVV